MAETNTLLIDFETSPIKGYWWRGMYEVNPIKILEHSRVLSYAYKWYGGKEIKCLSQRMFPTYAKDKVDNKLLMKSLVELYERAEYVVAHNLKKFDDRVANKGIIMNAITPPKRHRVIDTLTIAKSEFNFDSNKLDDLAALLKIGRKLPHTGFPMWEGCMDGVLKDWLMMEKYNKHDIFLLEGVYEKFRPFIERPKLKRLR
jgi:hypothetical protein